MSSYSVYSDPNGASVLKWKVVGSNDGTTWSIIDSQDFTTTFMYWNGKTSATFPVTTGSYKYYRLICQTITIGATYVAIPQFNIIVVTPLPVTTITPPSTLFTSNTLDISGQTPSFLNGTYTASCSSYSDANWYPWNAFNGSSIYSGWGTSSTYSKTTGIYSGATSTTVSGSSTLGEWLQLKIPNAKTMSSYNIYKDLTFACSVLQWKVVGSNDNSTWTLIDSQNFTSTPTYWSGKTSATFTVSTDSYVYYRLICQASAPGGQYNYLIIKKFDISVFTSDTVPHINALVTDPIIIGEPTNSRFMQLLMME
jgi:hypothetical protein